LTEAASPVIGAYGLELPVAALDPAVWEPDADPVAEDEAPPDAELAPAVPELAAAVPELLAGADEDCELVDPGVLDWLLPELLFELHAASTTAAAAMPAISRTVRA
jgi:hypothetical protein